MCARTLLCTASHHTHEANECVCGVCVYVCVCAGLSEDLQELFRMVMVVGNLDLPIAKKRRVQEVCVCVPVYVQTYRVVVYTCALSAF